MGTRAAYLLTIDGEAARIYSKSTTILNMSSSGTIASQTHAPNHTLSSAVATPSLLKAQIPFIANC